MKASIKPPRSGPYSDDEAKTLLASVMSPETTDWHYNKHHKGYVAKLNEIQEKLPSADKATANANYGEFSELKRQESFNHAGMVLHDIFWENLGGDGKVDESLPVAAKIIEDFGSVDAFKAELKAAALGAKNSGWAVLILDVLGDNKLHVAQVDFHHFGAWWGAIPLIAIDVFEHAYYHKNGPDRGGFVDAFIDSLQWQRINGRFEKYCK